MNRITFSLDELKMLLSSVVDDQSIPLENRIADSYKLLEQDKLTEVYTETILSLLQSLEIMHKENIIDAEQFNGRISALQNILESVEELSSIDKQ